MRIAIVGSREFRSLELVDAFVATLAPGDIVVTGGARGVDRRAERAAKARGLKVEIFLPDWDGYGKQAGLRRNALMVSVADHVVAFWDGRSRGTKFSMDLASKAGKFDKLFVDTRGVRGGVENPR